MTDSTVESDSKLSLREEVQTENGAGEDAVEQLGGHYLQQSLFLG